MTPSQKLIDAAAEALYDADRKMHPPSRSTWPKWKDAPDDVKDPYRSAVTIPVTVALKAAIREAEEVRHPNWSAENEDWCAGTMAAARAISSLIPAQEKTNDA
jgi:hypothetical protein